MVALMELEAEDEADEDGTLVPLPIKKKNRD
jgi:hypothetical protein